MAWENRRLLSWAIRGRHLSAFDWDDWNQYAMLVLFRAALIWSAAHGRFSTYAVLALRRHAERWQPHSRIALLGATDNDISAPTDTETDILELQRLRDSLNRLSQRSRDIVLATVDGRMRDAAQSHGISRQRAHKIYQTAMVRLRSLMLTGDNTPCKLTSRPPSNLSSPPTARAA